MKLSAFLFPIIMCWILYLSGENFRFLLFIVIFVICVCILIVSCSVFLNWVYWARGNFSGGPGHVHIRMCESPLCGVPGRYEYIWSLCRCGWRGSTDFLSSLLCSGMFGRIEMVGVAGQYRFSSFPALFWRVRYDWNGGVVLWFLFHFLQFFVNSLGERICAVGILRYTFCSIL